MGRPERLEVACCSFVVHGRCARVVVSAEKRLPNHPTRKAGRTQIQSERQRELKTSRSDAKADTSPMGDSRARAKRGENLTQRLTANICSTVKLCLHWLAAFYRMMAGII